MQGVLSKAVADLEILIDTYGEESVLTALADIAVEPDDMLSEGPQKARAIQSLAKSLFDLIMKSAGGSAKLAAKPVASAISRSLDQDIHISSQGPVLKVTDPGLHDLISQTNELIKKTHELLMGTEEAINTSTKELEDVNISIDDLVGTETGELASDVEFRQGAGLSPKKIARPKPEEEEL